MDYINIDKYIHESERQRSQSQEKNVSTTEFKVKWNIK